MPAQAADAELTHNHAMILTITRRSALLLPAVLLVAACAATGGGPGWTFAPLGPTQPPTAEPSASGSAPPAGNVIDLEATANLRFAQDGQPVEMLDLTVGEEYTFRVDNTSGFVHNIWLGPPDRLAARDHDGLPGVPEWESGVKEFTWTATADAQGWEFACTVPGHYEAGMRGDLMVAEGN
jgi:hypothetical protein